MHVEQVWVGPELRALEYWMRCVECGVSTAVLPKCPAPVHGVNEVRVTRSKAQAATLALAWLNKRMCACDVSHLMCLRKHQDHGAWHNRSLRGAVYRLACRDTLVRYRPGGLNSGGTMLPSAPTSIGSCTSDLHAPGMHAPPHYWTHHFSSHATMASYVHGHPPQSILDSLYMDNASMRHAKMFVLVFMFMCALA